MVVMMSSFGSQPPAWMIASSAPCSQLQGEFDRMKAAGATVVREPYNPGGPGDGGLIATLSDPDDNYFQLMSPMGPM